MCFDWPEPKPRGSYSTPLDAPRLNGNPHSYHQHMQLRLGFDLYAQNACLIQKMA